MTRSAWIAALILALAARNVGSAGEPPCGEPDRPCFLQRVAPAGGWFPYGSPVHWWNPHCFPNCSGPDDYCRKSLPCICRPTYPPFYVWGPPPAAPEQLPAPRPSSLPASVPPPGRVTGERAP